MMGVKLRWGMRRRQHLLPSQRPLLSAIVIMIALAMIGGSRSSTMIGGDVSRRK